MDQNKLNELKELARKATPGDWFVISSGQDAYAIGAETKPCETLVISSYYDSNEMRVYGLSDKLNAAYIAAANPSVVLALIARIEQIEKEANWLAAMLGNGEDCVADCAGVPCVCAMSNKAYPYKEEYVQTYCKPCWREAASKAVESSNE